MQVCVGVVCDSMRELRSVIQCESVCSFYDYYEFVLY